jgi:type VI secretion system protein ImpC
MTKFSRSSVVLDAEAEPATYRETDPDAPFRILVMGDFSGRTNRNIRSGLAGRRPVLIDLDNFEEVMEQMQPSLRLPGLELRFREIDDFHPDHLHRNLDFFQRLADLPYQPPQAVRAAPIPSGAGLLDSILEQSGETSPATVEDANDLPAFIRKVTAGHVEERPEAGKVEWEARKQRAAGEKMKAILHHPDFQALEAGWRAVWLLVYGLGDDAKIYLVDATRQELMEDVASLEKLVAGPREPWALLIGNFVFAENAGDAAHLAMLGRLAAAAGAPFLAEAQPPSTDDAPAEWRQLRESSVAPWIGLALPRFLLRLPYGKETSLVESFQFEEMEGSVHSEYLWGNPAFCLACLIGQSFRKHGWDLRPGMDRKLTSLPLHVYKSGPETAIKPCAEILLSENDADVIMERGYIPVASMKDQDAVLVIRFQSIADPPTGLAGRWRPTEP